LPAELQLPDSDVELIEGAPMKVDVKEKGKKQVQKENRQTHRHRASELSCG